MISYKDELDKTVKMLKEIRTNGQLVESIQHCGLPLLDNNGGVLKKMIERKKKRCKKQLHHTSVPEHSHSDLCKEDHIVFCFSLLLFVYYCPGVPYGQH